MSDENQPLNSFLDSLQSSLQDVAGGVTKKRKITPEETKHPVAFGFTDINKYEYSARTLQKHIRQIISGAPTTEELERIAEDKSVDEIVRQEVKSNSSLQMIAQLKSLYNAKKLPLFDEILANNVQEGKASTTGSVSTVSSKSNESGDGGGKKVGSKAREAGLPSLPKIKDPQLRARVFQHKSLATHKTYLDQSEIVLAHNERVEFLGDSVLNTMVTYILYERFPNSPEGQLSQIRALLVNNRTLAEFSLKYGFDKELRCNIDVSALGIGNQKIYADIFEAYLGALAMERGYDLHEVQNWLAKLMEPQLMKFEIENKKTPPINKDAKTELYSLVGTASTHPVYKITKSGNGSRNPFKVQCVIGDEVLGEGMAPNFRDAGLRAAMAALENKELLEKFGRQRLETDRSDSVKKSEGSSKGTANGISLPFVADHTIFPSKIARNEVYSHLGKTYGISPEYRVEFEEKKKRYKAELIIGQKVVAVAYDASKKHAMNRAAMLILNNQDSLHDIIGMVL